MRVQNTPATLQRALLLLMTVAAAPSAQQSPPLDIGERVRVWDSPWHYQVGRVTAVDADSLTLAIGPAGSPAAFRRSQVYLLEASEGRDSRSPVTASAEWGGVGALGGAISGAIVGDALAGAAACTSCWRDRAGAPAFGVLGAAAGALLGITYGLHHRGEAWRPVPFETRIGVEPALRRGLALSVSVHR
jgi:hypothetical protein